MHLMNILSEAFQIAGCIKVTRFLSKKDDHKSFLYLAAILDSAASPGD